MRFKIDENLPVEISGLLASAGHDACTVNDQRLQGAHDAALIGVCKNEGRVMVTLDTDFADIRVYPPEEFSGIVVLRPSSQDKRHLLDLFRRTISLFQQEPLDRHLWIVEDDKIRIRGKDTDTK